VAAVETVLEQARADGRPSLVTYVTGGIRPGWPALLQEMAAAGADAIEIGLPFSDPMLDGPVIQEACAAAIARGATVDAILDQVRELGPPAVPLIAMTYAHHACRRGLPPFCQALAAAGFSGVIIPDIPDSESRDYLAAASDAGLDATLMVSPVTPVKRVRAVASRTRGFLYLMSVMDTTGRASEAQDDQRWVLADRARPLSPRPALIGFGIDSPPRAAAAARHADGVIVASALMAAALRGAGDDEIGAEVAALRAALDEPRR
jgi:tryptophan synthase alpha chain